MTEPTIDLGTLHQDLGANREIRDAIKGRYDAILEEADALGHERAAVHGDPQGMNLRIDRNVGGFLPKDQAVAAARVAGWNAEMDSLAQAYAVALMTARAINAEIAIISEQIAKQEREGNE